MRLIDDTKNPTKHLTTSELTPLQLKTISHTLSKAVLEAFAKEQISVLQLAKKLRVHEQTLYYLIHKLVKAKLLTVHLNDTGLRYYKPSEKSYFVKITDFEEGTSVKSNESSLLFPFIDNGAFQSKIIVGSPDPHGPHLARSKDGYFGMDLAVFLGTFVTTFPGSVVKLDTESKLDDLQDNLIVIGGPIVNQVSAKITNGPVSFDVTKRAFVVKKGKKIFVDEDIGIITKQKSPFAKNKYILYFAGIRNFGTRAAIQGFIKHYAEFEQYASKNDEFCAVVRGEDLDSDGVVDNASIVGFY